MAWKIERRDDVKSLLHAILNLMDNDAKDPNDRIGYRGQADAAWKLEPTIDRALPPHDDYTDRFAVEGAIVQEFRKETCRFFDPLETAFVGEQRAGVTTAVLSVMQHYGAPTRLLDWSYSPFVALYFACVHHADKDGAVWWFRRKPFNDLADSGWQSYGCPRESDGTVNLNALAFKLDAADWFCATDYLLPFVRLTRQHGFFTIAGRLGVDHGKRIESMLSGQSVPEKWVIPAQSKHVILEYLHLMNVNAMSLHYEGADSVGRGITERLRRQREQR